MRTVRRTPRPRASTEPTVEPSAHHIYVQLAWSTLGRLPLMSTELRGQVEGQLIALCRRLDVEPVAVRATADRVRLLVRIKPNHALATLVPRLKQGSQDALTAAGRGVHWASGYAVSTVSASALRRVIRRIGDLD
ncbi:MAG: transposase [Gemmatimonadales bacterium]|jgi:REP element-mobilizing transposase RayT